MTTSQKIALALLRISVGWYFFYAGITKVLDPAWSAAGFLANAKMLPGFYALFTSPSVLPFINFLNAWGITLIGVSLILGVSLRLSSFFGVLLMILYYIPQEGAHTFIIDDHVIISFALIVLTLLNAGGAYGFKNWLTALPVVERIPALKWFFS